MGLYDSGPHGFVSSFAYTFTAAGDYPYRSTPTGISATYKILPSAPPTGATGTPFTLRWASTPPAPGFAFDVRCEPPGAPTYQPWQTATTQRSGTFTPTVGRRVQIPGAARRRQHRPNDQLRLVSYRHWSLCPNHQTRVLRLVVRPFAYSR